MKKSILALSAAVAVSGLGFAGAANALAIFGPGSTTPTATEVAYSPSGIGHLLFAPYYTTQADNNTLLSVINTDTVNGKAVKVRFRGAANSDDVLDFTLFLSPGDVWTGSLTQSANGLAQLDTQDTSCTLPNVIKNKEFVTERLQASLTAAAKAAHTREGYVEFLNMADIPPGSALYTNIKHDNGVAPCKMAAFDALTSLTVADAAAAEAAGLRMPTGGLTGGWILVRNSNISTYSGLHTAVVATTATRDAAGNPAQGASANFVFAPQSPAIYTGTATVNTLTADPLFNSTDASVTLNNQLLWQDLPDMSSPLVGTNATTQAEGLTARLVKSRVVNEFVSTAAGASVPGDTDWVVSQPTRRYQAAVNYRNLDGGTPALVTNPTTGAPHYGTANSFVLKRTVGGVDLGSFLCVRGAISGTDREEGGDRVSFSPSPSASAYCGEVFTLSFNRDSSQVLSAALTNTAVKILVNDKPVQAGWATFTPAVASTTAGGLPITGFAATSLKDQRANGGNYGYTYGHRW